MRQGTVVITVKGKQAIEDYQRGYYNDANLSELEFALLKYVQSKQHDGLDVSDSLGKYGTEGTAALETLLEEGKIQYHYKLAELSYA